GPICASTRRCFRSCHQDKEGNPRRRRCGAGDSDRSGQAGRRSIVYCSADARKDSPADRILSSFGTVTRFLLAFLGTGYAQRAAAIPCAWRAQAPPTSNRLAHTVLWNLRSRARLTNQALIAGLVNSAACNLTKSYMLIGFWPVSLNR